MMTSILVLVWINFLQMMSVGEWQILKKKITQTKINARVVNDVYILAIEKIIN